MSFFPSSQADFIDEKSKKIPRAEEWAWDFNKADFALKNGKMYKVYDDEAIKIWLWKLFLVDKYRYPVHSLVYGNEFHTLIGKGYTKGYINAVAEQMIKEAIEYNLKDYIKRIYAVDSDTPIVSFKNGTLYIIFYADTIYNEEVGYHVIYHTNA